MSGMILLYTNLVHIQYRRMKLFILQKNSKNTENKNRD